MERVRAAEERESTVREKLRKETGHKCIDVDCEEPNSKDPPLDSFGKPLVLGNPLVRRLLAAMGKIESDKIGMPDAAVIKKEEELRAAVVSEPGLAAWKEVGFYEDATLHTFLSAACSHFGRGIAIVDKVEVYDGSAYRPYYTGLRLYSVEGHESLPIASLRHPYS